MKNLVLFLCLFTTLNAQDIITTRSGDEIKSKVTEITQTEIKYKKHSNPTGPTYTINKSDVFMIKYQNGDKELFKEESKTQTPIIETKESKKIKSDQKVIKEDTRISNNTKEDLKLINERLRIRRGFWAIKYYKGDSRIDFEELEVSLKTNEIAYNDFIKGYKNYQLGNLISVPAAILTGASLGFIIGGNESTAATACLLGGLTFNLVSILVSSNGYKKMHKAVHFYNRSNGFGLNSGNDGVGIAYRFN